MKERREKYWADINEKKEAELQAHQHQIVKVRAQGWRTFFWRQRGGVLDRCINKAYLMARTASRSQTHTVS